ncbi:MAG: TerB family tellurite resistance protein [Candidatus Pelagibacter sp. TMED106]|jgi:uncharacterized tellurite resistance protein B-like protein|nr:MAG: TerB family tellurite resistance protein [Candidatus Pelagibacter sp. TMED106]|tara:strand:- start:827 stop:1252 length:426 start_codon:yes stop_codon:yes gene_type:complete
MINIFKNKEKNKLDDSFLSKITPLLIHAAKIDESYTSDEKEIIKKTLLKLGAEKENIDQIISKAEISEENSNQILDFTKEVKNASVSEKIKIIEALWKIIYSNQKTDMYEENLMRRLAGLLYVDNKTMVDIKEKVKKEFSK